MSFRPELLGDPAADLSVVVDMLLLVGVHADIDVMYLWSPLERAIAMNWACRVHLSASDNLNRVPPRPYIVKPEWGGEGAEELRTRGRDRPAPDIFEAAQSLSDDR